jgi:hypothetical protein
MKNPSGSSCQNGACVCSDSQESCNNQCVDKCRSDQVRDSTNCSCTCPEEKEEVNGQCLDKCRSDQIRDPSNNMCTCRPDQLIDENGLCTCADGEEEVSGQCLDICEDDQFRDPRDNKCKCSDIPGGTLEICDNKCIDPATDEANCGGCAGQSGIVCTQDQICQNGSCEAISCTPLSSESISAPDGGGQICDNACVDTYSDENNCGDCGFICPVGTDCIFDSSVEDGVCKPPPCFYEGFPADRRTSCGGSDCCITDGFFGIVCALDSETPDQRFCFCGPNGMSEGCSVTPPQ